MRSLSLWQPWAGVVAAGIKRIENRSWPPPRSVIGHRIAIHASKKWDKDGAQFCRSRLGDDGLPPLGAVHGAVVGVVTVVGVIHVSSASPKEYIEQVKTWFFGPYGWLLEDAVAMRRPVPCRGFQGLWALPGDVEANVLAQVGRRSVPVTDDLLDAPDGAVVEDPVQGGLFERRGLRWEPSERVCVTCRSCGHKMNTPGWVPQKCSKCGFDMIAGLTTP